jgi:hypothetical protein
VLLAHRAQRHLQGVRSLHRLVRTSTAPTASVEESPLESIDPIESLCSARVVVVVRVATVEQHGCMQWCGRLCSVHTHTSKHPHFVEGGNSAKLMSGVATVSKTKELKTCYGAAEVKNQPSQFSFTAPRAAGLRPHSSPPDSRPQTWNSFIPTQRNNPPAKQTRTGDLVVTPCCYIPPPPYTQHRPSHRPQTPCWFCPPSQAPSGRLFQLNGVQEHRRPGCRL